LIERNRRYGCGRIRPDPRKFEKLSFRTREFAAVLLYNLAGATVEITRSAVVAQSGPGAEDIIEVRRRQRLDRRPTRKKLFKVGDNGLHGGLLQHDLAEPDVIGIRHRAWGSAPRQIAPFGIVPVEQSCSRVTVPFALH